MRIEGQRRRTSTSKSLKKEDCCGFRLTVFLGHDDFWYLQSSSNPGCKHNGHLKMDPALICLPVCKLMDEDQRVVRDGVNGGLSDADIANLLAVRTEGVVSQAQIRHFRQQSLVDKLKGGNDKLSAAGELVKLFDGYDDVSYMMVCHDAENIVVVSKKPGRKKPEEVKVDWSVCVPYAEQVSSIRNDMIVEMGSSTKRLLAIGWSTDDELRNVAMFPESLSCDCTSQVNSQKRDLFTVAAKDGSNKCFLAFRAFLSNQKRSTFLLLFGTMMPALFGKDTCRRVSFIATDGDTDEIEMVKATIEVSSLGVVIVKSKILCFTAWCIPQCKTWTVQVPLA